MNADQQRRFEEIGANLASVRQRMATAASNHDVRLVAVSKTKPAEDVQHAYAHGQRHFGENYVQELVEKAQNALIAGTNGCPDVRWHFIGHLQSNKCKMVVEGVPNLWMVESVDSERKADALNKAAVNAGRRERLRVLIQINASEEDSKHGITSESCVTVAKHIVERCPALEFRGLMTIGMAERELQPGQVNPDFQVCIEFRI